VNVAAAALQWQGAGFSTIPIKPNADRLPGQWKKPVGSWREFQERIASVPEVNAWWSNGHEYGLAVIMGAVSGGAELLELEARACGPEILSKIQERCDANGVGHIWDEINFAEGAYVQGSPTGGFHFIYRIKDHAVPGNTKVARRPATSEELATNPDDRVKVMAETRGEGGYVVMAPTSGLCHPTGQEWRVVMGVAGTVVSLTWEERNGLHDSIREACDIPLTPAPTVSVAGGGATGGGTLVRGQQSGETGVRPGDAIDDLPWSHHLLLGGAGWQVSHQQGETTYWTRPGKSVREGASATTGRAADRDRLYVFSTSTIFPTDTPITKFGTYALLHHNGDHSAAARALRQDGFGDPLPEPQVRFLPDFLPHEQIEGESSNIVFTMDDLGARRRLAHYTRGNYKWVWEEDVYYKWDGAVWAPDHDRTLTEEFDAMTLDLLHDNDPDVVKWAKKHRGGGHMKFAVREMRSVKGVTQSRSRFDLDRGHLNLRNGIMNLRSGELVPHDRERYMTRMFNASYNPDATCPNWRSFMEQVLPDPEVRAYVQRAVGYSMLGDADQRALFLVWGPSGTGKSQFTETMQYLFGDYGTTASLGAFMGGQERGPSNEVHRLRGKRFVSTSETADNTRFNEEVVKRLTGRDTMATRALYQQEQEWTPECAIWIATNHKPKFNSDDDAIWRRSKLLPFLTRFGSEDGPEEIYDYARRFLFAERDGILNWMLEGLRAFLAEGLQEPQALKDAALEHRQEVDQVATFMEEQTADGKLVAGEQQRMRTSVLYTIYVSWCQNSSERPYGRRRFTNRLLTNLVNQVPEAKAVNIGGHASVVGIGQGALIGAWGLNQES
jgi:putative DNA primase/helicase